MIKVARAWQLFRELIAFYAATRLLNCIRSDGPKTYEALEKIIPPSPKLTAWANVGGQLIRDSELKKMLQQIRNGRIKGWDEIHAFYARQGASYPQDTLEHALAALKEAQGISLKRGGRTALKDLLMQSITTKEWMTKGIYSSRAKDYSNPFRKMVYDSPEEMNIVIGSLQDNSFIRQEKLALTQYRKEVEKIILKYKL